MSLIALEASARALVDDLNAREWSGLIARCCYHVCFEDMVTASSTSNVQQSVDSLKQWVTSFPDLRVILKSQHSAETMDIAELMFEGHQQGGFQLKTERYLPPVARPPGLRALSLRNSKTRSVNPSLL